MKIKNKIGIFLSGIFFNLFWVVNFAWAQRITFPINTGLPEVDGGIPTLVTNVALWILGILGSLAVIGFAISGLQYITAAGSEDAMEKGKRNMMYSIIGVIIALSAVIIIKTIDMLLSGGGWWF